jgi:hypothetical protein
VCPTARQGGQSQFDIRRYSAGLALWPPPWPSTRLSDRPLVCAQDFPRGICAHLWQGRHPSTFVALSVPCIRRRWHVGWRHRKRCFRRNIYRRYRDLRGPGHRHRVGSMHRPGCRRRAGKCRGRPLGRATQVNEATEIRRLVYHGMTPNPALQRTVQQRLRRCRPAAELRR